MGFAATEFVMIFALPEKKHQETASNLLLSNIVILMSELRSILFCIFLYLNTERLHFLISKCLFLRI